MASLRLTSIKSEMGSAFPVTASAYQTFSQVTDNQVILSGLPVGIKTELGNYYPV